MRFELLEQLLAPRITMRDIEDGLRTVFARDPMKAEAAIGQMYGHYFRKREEKYDAAQARERIRKVRRG